MSAFIKLNNSRTDRYVKLTLNEGVTQVYGHSTFAITLAGATITQLSKPKPAPFKKDGKETEVVGNGPVLLSLGTATPFRYEMMLSAHPELYKKGIVSMPTMLPPNKEVDLALTLQPFGELDGLKDLPWLISLYLLD